MNFVSLPASWAESIYAYFYRRRRANALQSTQRMPARVISVGNLTVGGTGKTPTVQWLAQHLQRHQRVVIVATGYGGSLRGLPQIVSDGSKVLLNAEQAGDEAVLHAQRLAGSPVLIGRDRVAACRLACERFKPDLLLLDDAFQYWSLQRDFDLVLLDARRPFGNGRLLPVGRLREPVSELARASAILLTRCREAGEQQIAATTKAVAALTAAPVFQSDHTPISVLVDGDVMSLKHLHGAAVWSLSALADNAGFAAGLRGLGARVIGGTARRDHHRWRPGEVQSAALQALKAGAAALVTTEKDSVKLSGAELPLPLWILRIELTVYDEKGLLALLFG